MKIEFNKNDVFGENIVYKDHIEDFIKNDIQFNNYETLKVSVFFIDPLDTIIEIKVDNGKLIKTFIYQPLNNHRIEEED